MRYWYSSDKVREYIRDKMNGTILDIGAGDRPFGTHTVDLRKGDFVRDVCLEGLPDFYPDFVYCSHMLEDCVNPEFVCREINRVCMAGYIETPSVASEFCREVEADGVPYRGHHHHRWFIWYEEDVLYLLPKYSIIEYMEFNDKAMLEVLDENPLNWVNCFFWEGRLKYKHLQHNIDFNIREGYDKWIERGIKQSLENAEKFFQEVYNFEEETCE